MSDDRSYDLAEVQAIAAQGRRLAIYDRATGLYAYWYLELRAEEELSRAQRFNKQAVLLSIWAPTPDDIERTAAHLKAGLRAYDLAAYLNNGHFLVILNETNHEGAQIVLERLRESVGCTVGAGLACFPDDGITFDTLLTHAKASAEENAAAA